MNPLVITTKYPRLKNYLQLDTKNLKINQKLQCSTYGGRWYYVVKSSSHRKNAIHKNYKKKSFCKITGSSQTGYLELLKILLSSSLERKREKYAIIYTLAILECQVPNSGKPQMWKKLLNLNPEFLYKLVQQQRTHTI